MSIVLRRFSAIRRSPKSKISGKYGRFQKTNCRIKWLYEFIGAKFRLPARHGNNARPKPFRRLNPCGNKNACLFFVARFRVSHFAFTKVQITLYISKIM